MGQQSKLYAQNSVVRDIYSAWDGILPNGYEEVAFRKLMDCDEAQTFLLASRGILADKRAVYYGLVGEWRLIVRKVEAKPEPWTKFTYTTTVEEIYGTIPTIPEGYEVIDFRPTIGGSEEPYIDTLGGGVSLSYCTVEMPRLILKPKVQKISLSTPYSVSIKDIYKNWDGSIPAGWQFKAFATPQKGECYVNRHFPSEVIESKGYAEGPYVIVEKV